MSSRRPGSLLWTLGRWLGVAAVAVTGLSSLVGSGGGGGGSDAPAALTVIVTSPTNGATGVAVNSTILATFSENLANIPTLTVSSCGGAVPGSVSRSGSTVAFVPASALAASTTYTVAVSGGSGAAGGTQSGSTSWSFTTAGPASGAISINGTADFQSVPNDNGSDGHLLYNNITNKPIRCATVEVLAAPAGTTVLATGTTSSTGTYSLTIPTAQSVIVRVRAEMKKASGAGGTWDITVRDNTVADALYVLDSPAFNAVAGTNTQNLRANSGWGGASYTGTRAAAPFAVLDAVYDAVQKVLTASPNADFPQLKLMWSVNNRPTAGDITLGQINTTSYLFTPASGHRILVLGLADTDTDEYDRTVIAHEFGHYFQATFSRDDSIGGPHSAGDTLDMRVAFSEGWGNAWSGMALGTQYYTDSFGPGQQLGGRTDLAASPANNRGWFNEGSVQYLMYQWHANPSIGFAPIFNVMNAMPTTLAADAALSSIHHFAHYLKLAVPGQATTINNLLTSQSITVTSPLGVGETNSGGTVPIAEALPVYRTFTAAIPGTQNFCLTDAAGQGGYEPNKLGANIFIRFTRGAAAPGSLTVASTNVAVADPDFDLIRSDGSLTPFNTGGGTTETTGTISLAAGTHIVVLNDWALTTGPNRSINNGQRCFNVTIN